jgi:hypothetical protein
MLKSPATIVARGVGARGTGRRRRAAGGRRAPAVRLAVEVAQRDDLRIALVARPVLEVRRHDAHRAERRLDDRLDRDARHRRHGRIGRPRKRVAPHLPDRQPRRDRVAEAAPPTVGARMVGADAIDDRVARQQARERRELVGIVVALEQRRGKVVRQLLDAEDVEIRERARLRDHARGIDAAVEAAEPLHVPGDEVHAPAGPPQGRAPPGGGAHRALRGDVIGFRRA